MTKVAATRLAAPSPDAAGQRFDPLTGGELGWRLQHGCVLPYAATDDAGAVAWEDEHPLKLDRYLAQGRITEPQHAAGERFRELWLVAGREPPSTLDYSPLRGRRYEMSDAAALADRRCRDAERAVPGVCRLAVTAVCCWDQHAPIAPLREGLTALAGFFGTDRPKRRD